MKKLISRRVTVATFVACLLLFVGCTAESSVSDSAPPLPDPNQERVVYTALGGDETLNRELEDSFRDAWPQRVFTEALPRSAIYVNFARPDATVAGALTDQLPQSLAVDPTVATVWLGASDARRGTSEASFERDLSEIVEDLQSAGARVLLLAPDGGDDGFSGASQRVAAMTDATLVVVPGGDRRLPATQAAIADAVAAQLAL